MDGFSTLLNTMVGWLVMDEECNEKVFHIHTSSSSSSSSILQPSSISCSVPMGGWFTCSLSPFTSYQKCPSPCNFLTKILFSSPPLLLLFHKLFVLHLLCVCVCDMELCFYKNVTKIHLKELVEFNVFLVYVKYTCCCT